MSTRQQAVGRAAILVVAGALLPLSDLVWPHSAEETLRGAGVLEIALTLALAVAFFVVGLGGVRSAGLRRKGALALVGVLVAVFGTALWRLLSGTGERNEAFHFVMDVGLAGACWGMAVGILLNALKPLPQPTPVTFRPPERLAFLFRPWKVPRWVVPVLWAAGNIGLTAFGASFLWMSVNFFRLKSRARSGPFGDLMDEQAGTRYLEYMVAALAAMFLIGAAVSWWRWVRALKAPRPSPPAPSQGGADR